jgi:hypothetical protein
MRSARTRNSSSAELFRVADALSTRAGVSGLERIGDAEQLVALLQVSLNDLGRQA